MIRPIKWHIYQNGTDCPLTWNDKAIDFETEQEAKQFAAKYLIEEDDFYIKEDILYYDGNYITVEEIERKRA